MGVELKSVQIGNKEKRYVITDEASGPELLVTTNLDRCELRIELLQVGRCPIDQACVDVVQEASSICAYMGVFPFQLNGMESITKQVPCKYGNRFSFPEIETLTVLSCPMRITNCIDCRFLETIVVPSRASPQKSHACVVCRAAAPHGTAHHRPTEGASP